MEYAWQLKTQPLPSLSLMHQFSKDLLTCP